jgi:hypothetical protein
MDQCKVVNIYVNEGIAKLATLLVLDHLFKKYSTLNILLIWFIKSFQQTQE